jgi:5-methylcytosine-specific restriction endonuclease McrA
MSNGSAITRDDAAAAFTAFCEDRLSPEEGAAVLLACAERRGLPWSRPRKALVWDALQYFCRAHLTAQELNRYGTVISDRLAAGTPAVDPARVRRVVWNESRRLTIGKRSSRPASHRVARDADEFLDQQKQMASDRARRIHVRNQRSERYRELRSQALAAAGHRCERCNGSGQLELHHKHYATLGFETLKDIEMLCRSCHETETQRQWALRRARWKPFGAGGITAWK